MLPYWNPGHTGRSSYCPELRERVVVDRGLSQRDKPHLVRQLPPPWIHVAPKSFPGRVCRAATNPSAFSGRTRHCHPRFAGWSSPRGVLHR
jgi:hypothetical protein